MLIYKSSLFIKLAWRLKNPQCSSLIKICCYVKWTSIVAKSGSEVPYTFHIVYNGARSRGLWYILLRRLVSTALAVTCINPYKPSILFVGHL